jgi:hypothetical protein
MTPITAFVALRARLCKNACAFAMMGLPTQGAVEPVKISRPAPSCGASSHSPVSDRPGSTRLLTRFLLSNRLTGSYHPLSASNRAGCLSGKRNIGPMPKVSLASQHGTILMAGFGTHR